MPWTQGKVWAEQGTEVCVTQNRTLWDTVSGGSYSAGARELTEEGSGHLQLAPFLGCGHSCRQRPWAQEEPSEALTMQSTRAA